MIEELGIRDMTVREFLDDLRDIKGYTSIICPFTEEYLADHNRMFFYDGDVLEYQVGTKRLVKAVVDGSQFTIMKDGVEYKGANARSQFKNDRDFKQWRKTCDGVKNALVKDACANIQAFQLNAVCSWVELQMQQELSFCTIRELMSFVLSREFEAMQARYMPFKKT